MIKLAAAAIIVGAGTSLARKAKSEALTAQATDLKEVEKDIYEHPDPISSPLK